MAFHRRLGRLSLVDSSDLGPSCRLAGFFWRQTKKCALWLHFWFSMSTRTTKDSSFQHLESKLKLNAQSQESSFEIKFPLLRGSELSTQTTFLKNRKFPLEKLEITKLLLAFCLFYTNMWSLNHLIQEWRVGAHGPKCVSIHVFNCVANWMKQGPNQWLPVFTHWPSRVAPAGAIPLLPRAHICQRAILHHLANSALVD